MTLGLLHDGHSFVCAPPDAESALLPRTPFLDCDEHMSEMSGQVRIGLHRCVYAVLVGYLSLGPRRTGQTAGSHKVRRLRSAWGFQRAISEKNLSR